MWFGPTVRVMISDPSLIREIFLLNSDKFEKIETPPSAKKLEGDGLSNLKGEKWAHHRKILNQTFYLENLKATHSTATLFLCYTCSFCFNLFV